MLAVITLKSTKFAAVRTAVRGNTRSISLSASRRFLTRLLHALAVGAA